jgi:hypothetical protein
MPPDRGIKVACEQVRCDNWLYGWDTVLDERTREGREAAAWIRSGASRRDYREMRGGEVTVFRFTPHQRCFEEHRTRPARWLVRGVREHSGMSGWIGDLDQHVGQLAEQLKKG